MQQGGQFQAKTRFGTKKTSFWILCPICLFVAGAQLSTATGRCIAQHPLCMSNTFSLKTTQRIPVSLDKAWSFFSDPANLKTITPADLGFEIISKHHGGFMYAGQIIEYTVKPLLGIPMYWMTEITHVEDKKFFVDEQRFGPYQLWHHQHHFKPIEGGVEMTDIVHYRIPMGIIGNLANGILVKSQLRKIFGHRFKAVETTFGAWKGKPVENPLVFG